MLYTFASHPTVVFTGLPLFRVPVTCVDGAVEHLAPVFLFSRIGEGCAERWPDLFERDLSSDCDGPVDLAVGSGVFNNVQREKFGNSFDGEVC